MSKPIAQELKLDPRKLPAQVFERFVEHAFNPKARQEDARLAWESFGKPGRDPTDFSQVFQGIAAQGKWVPYLKVAQLRDHWDQVVGPVIGRQSRVLSYEQGRLIIQARTTVWATQLTYLVPQLKGTISQRLNMPVDEIQVTGPRSSRFAAGR
ncbi:hypothetical protein KIM372_00050 [Bombiscardovia nodaiensis]|uniref:DUF721 domain-containing protein n=1 Tax=Bombiscardovia nodaiensis TaxID=2932181 RepID=A0ABN6SA58_9BIFI|nr:hypothetical protein KIM372_00050 [Bombiscardovia nodaiensis]